MVTDRPAPLFFPYPPGVFGRSLKDMAILAYRVTSIGDPFFPLPPPIVTGMAYRLYYHARSTTRPAPGQTISSSRRHLMAHHSSGQHKPLHLSKYKAPPGDQPGRRISAFFTDLLHFFVAPDHLMQYRRKSKKP